MGTHTHRVGGGRRETETWTEREQRDRKTENYVGLGSKTRERMREETKDKTNQFKRCGFLLVVTCESLVVSVKL